LGSGIEEAKDKLEDEYVTSQMGPHYIAANCSNALTWISQSKMNTLEARFAAIAYLAAIAMLLKKQKPVTKKKIE